MFLKLAEVVESEKFKDLDPDNKNVITKRDFQRQLESAKNYDPEEVDYVLKLRVRNNICKKCIPRFLHFHELKNLSIKRVLEKTNNYEKILRKIYEIC